MVPPDTRRHLRARGLVLSSSLDREAVNIFRIQVDSTRLVVVDLEDALVDQLAYFTRRHTEFFSGFSDSHDTAGGANPSDERSR